MTTTIQANGHDQRSSVALKQRLLRELNSEARTIQIALNQAHNALTYAQKLMEETYQRKRSAILNGHGHGVAVRHRL